MRQSTSLKFNYAGISGNTYTQSNRATTNVLYSQPPPAYQLNQTPVKVNQSTTVLNNQNQVSYNLLLGSLH